MHDARAAVAILLSAALAVWWLTTPRPPTSPVLAATAPGAAMYSEPPNGSPTPATDGAPATLALPFDVAEGWRYTGGIHGAWKAPNTAPVAADFAPPSNFADGMGGRARICDPAPEWALSPLAGTVTRADDARLWIVGDDGRTEVLVLHMSDLPPVGAHLAAGDRMGHPACEGSALASDGAHVHIAVMVNGRWMAPSLGGWTFEVGRPAYTGNAYGPGGRVLCPAYLGEACADSVMRR